MEALLPLLFLFPFAFIGVVFGVWIWGLVDALQVPADVFYRTGSKVLWGILIGVMGPVAAIIYFAAGRPDKTTRDWMAQQKAAGVDLRAYRVYDQGFGGAWPQRGGYGGPPEYGGGYGAPPGYGSSGYGLHPGAAPSPPDRWGTGDGGQAQYGSPPPGYPPLPPSR